MGEEFVMNTKSSLDAPGAGLPLFERLGSRLFFRFLAMTADKDKLTSRFSGEAERMVQLVQKQTETDCQKQVLISRVPGIEDSSRDWSAYMVLHHLVIVDTGIIDIVEKLVRDEEISLIVDIAEVKPDPKTDSRIIRKFQESVTDYCSRVEALGTLKSKKKHPHPWFGKMSPHEWHWLASVHHTIHRRQLQAILAGV